MDVATPFGIVVDAVAISVAFMPECGGPSVPSPTPAPITILIGCQLGRGWHSNGRAHTPPATHAPCESH